MFLLLLLLPLSSPHQIYYRPDCSLPTNYTTLPCSSTTQTFYHFQTQPTCREGCRTGAILPDVWYRLSNTTNTTNTNTNTTNTNTNIMEVAKSQHTALCPEQCEAVWQIHLLLYTHSTQFPASSYYTIVVREGGACHTPLEGYSDHDLRFIEKYDCEGFSLYRFPDNIAEVRCNPAEDVALLAGAGVSGSLLLCVVCAGVVLTVWKRRRKPNLPPPRVRRQPVYNVPAARGVSTHSYADLVTLGYSNPGNMVTLGYSNHGNMVQMPASTAPLPPYTAPQEGYINVGEKQRELEGYLTPDELILSNPESRDPGNVSRDPDNASRESGNESYDPSNESCEPGNVSCDPSNVSCDPGNVSRDPGNESRDPGNVSRDPGNESRDPGNESRDHDNASRDPHTIDPLSRLRPPSSRMLEELSAVPLPTHHKTRARAEDRIRRVQST